MSFTLNWPNRHVENYIVKNPDAPFPLELQPLLSELYADQLAQTTPPLTLLADTLIPNALAAGPELARRYAQFDSRIPDPGTEIPKAVGCIGNQLDEPFPYESRTPVALPLVMYPNGDSCQDEDPCALPVVNWTAHAFKLGRMRTKLPRLDESLYKKRPPLKVIGGSGTWRKRTKKVATTTTTAAPVPHEDDEPEDSEPESEPGDLNPNSSEFDIENPEPEPIPSTSTSVPKNPTKRRNNPKSLKKMKIYQVQKELFPPSTTNLEEKEYYIETSKNKKPCKPKPPTLPRRINFTRRIHPQNIRKQIALPTLQAYKDPPELRLMGTWNYLYGGTGAMAWSKDSHEPKNKNLFVGNGTKLRLVSIKPTETSKNSRPLLSYKVESIWEETAAPPPHITPTDLPQGHFTSQIYQIIPFHSQNILGVRRGRSIQIYDTDGQPSLLTSIPNICYGGVDYLGWDHKYRCWSRNPVLMSFDLCHWAPGQLATMDQNYVVQLLDFTHEKSITQFHSSITDYPSYRSSIYRPHGDYPLIELNRAAGLSYTNGNPNVLYHWVDSCLTLWDSREKMKTSQSTSGTGIKTLELLNLRYSYASHSLTEQAHFTSTKHNVIDEYLCGFKQTQSNPMQYWISTNSRIWLMDVRVPHSPIFKVTHFLRSPPVYLESFSDLNDSNYEILVCSSQKLNDTFCTVIDQSHSSCLNRPGCTAKVPILSSLPRVLTSSREFWDFSIKEGQAFGFAKDWNRAKAHCTAWTTGIGLMQGERLAVANRPAPFVLFTGNGFGDVFCQEWDQRPIAPNRQAKPGDERLTSFVKSWKKSMSTANIPHIPKPTTSTSAPKTKLQTVDHSLLLESNAESLYRSTKIRSKPFDPFTPHKRQFHRVSFGITPVAKEVENLRKLNPDSARAQRFLDVWNDDIGPGKAYINANGATGEAVDLEQQQPTQRQPAAPRPIEALSVIPEEPQVYIEDIKAEPESEVDPLMDTSDIEIIGPEEDVEEIEQEEFYSTTIPFLDIDVDNEVDKAEFEEKIVADDEDDNFNFEALWKSCSQLN